MSSCPHGRVFLLQNEVTLLRNEVAQLKQLLLAHKDCPVTALQKKTQGYLGEWCLLLLLLLLLSAPYFFPNCHISSLSRLFPGSSPSAEESVEDELESGVALGSSQRSVTAAFTLL